MLRKLLALLVCCLFSCLLRAQATVPEPAGENLFRLEGVDPESGIHYLKLIVLSTSAGNAHQTDPANAPRFTMECREQQGKRSLHWLLRFDPSPDFAFQRPNVATRQNPYPIQNPSTQLKMRFEGYMRSQEFKRQWEILPTGELHYRNSGMGSQNMEDAHYFLQWLNSLPNLRIGYAKPLPGQPAELVFPVQPILQELGKASLCSP